MVKVTLPLGSSEAHGAVGKSIVFQGTMARAYVIPEDAKSAAQLEVRSEFQDLTKILSFTGPWPRMVFYQAFGPRWFTLVYGWIKSNWEGFDTLARNKFDLFSPTDQLLWDDACPYLPGSLGIGRQFYRVIDMCYWKLHSLGVGMWELKHYQDGEYQTALDWWTKDASIYFEPGVYDDDDEHIGYSNYMASIGNPNAFGGYYHVGHTPDLTGCNFYFLGTLLKLKYIAYPDGATIKISIDGVDSYLNQSDPSSPYGHEWVSGIQSQGAHFVEIKQNGEGYSTLDGIEVS